MLPLVGASGQELLHEAAVLVEMLDGEGMVRAWSFEQLHEMVRGTFCGLLTPLEVGGGHEQALAPLLVLLLARAVGGAFIGVLVLLCLTLGAIENRPDRLLARGVAGGYIEELLGGSWAPMS